MKPSASQIVDMCNMTVALRRFDDSGLADELIRYIGVETFNSFVRGLQSMAKDMENELDKRRFKYVDIATDFRSNSGKA